MAIDVCFRERQVQVLSTWPSDDDPGGHCKEGDPSSTQALLLPLTSSSSSSLAFPTQELSASAPWRMYVCGQG